jgi:hypothetical protein
MVIAGILIDAGAQANFVAGQRAIYALPANIRSRLNALYLAFVFFGGALGSAVSGYAISRGGAPLLCGIGISIAGVALALFATEFLGRRRA